MNKKFDALLMEMRKGEELNMKRTYLIGRLYFLTVVFSSPAVADCYPSQGCWGALAQALWNDYNGTAKVSVGAAINHASEGDAHWAARRQCEIGSEGTICTVVGTFSHGGCGYITSGVRTGTGVRWATGATAAEAYNQCVSGGYNCDWPIGGCTAD